MYPFQLEVPHRIRAGKLGLEKVEEFFETDNEDGRPFGALAIFLHGITLDVDMKL